MLGILPFFHSFGFMGTLWLPAVLGIGVVYYPNPLDGKTIGPLVCDYNVTYLLSTPTLLQIYMRSCTPEQFGGLRVVITGAEKLPDRLALAFADRFGIHPMEGYGCTECSPCVAANKPDFRSAGYHQVGGKRGKIGHPLPGVSVRIVSPEAMTPVPPGQPGLMLVQGPNVMLGYLGLPEKTSEVLVFDSTDEISSVPATGSKWYVTGDIAMIDEDGFLQITDRLSRFSKIGGEMVPHGKVEEALHEAAGMTEQSFVVTGVKDTKKGRATHRTPQAGRGTITKLSSRSWRRAISRTYGNRAQTVSSAWRPFPISAQENSTCVGSGKWQNWHPPMKAEDNEHISRAGLNNL